MFQEPKEVCEVKDTLSTIPEVAAVCASEEAMTQSSPRYYARTNIAALVRKHQNDVKEELLSPSKLKEKHSDNNEKLVKEHKIQVWFKCTVLYTNGVTMIFFSSLYQLCHFWILEFTYLILEQLKLWNSLWSNTKFM